MLVIVRLSVNVIHVSLLFTALAFFIYEDSRF